jgi:hypothetical protein
VKNYQIKGGLSMELNTAKINDIYYIKGPMGKGLGLQKHGTHVFFLAGTGILIVLDLVALLIRVNLGLLNHDEVPIFSKGSTFKVVIYASFPSRTEAIGLELLEGLSEITKAKGLSNFQLHLRIGNE